MKVSDSGGYGVDGTLYGTYTIDTTKKIITFGSDGGIDTGFTLPTAAHIIVETYDIDGVSGAVDYHFFKRDASDVDTYLSSCQALVDAEVSAGRYTTYKMKATHYKGSGKADVYDADESTSFPTTPDSADVSYTPSTSTWKITDTVIAPVASYTPLHIALSSVVALSSALPSGVSINNITDNTDTTTVYNSLVDADGNSSAITMQVTTAFSGAKDEASPASGDTECIYDYQLEDNWYIGSGATADISIYLPAGTWKIKAGARRIATATDRYGEYTIDGTTKEIDASSETTTGHCAEWTSIISSGQYFTFHVAIKSGSTYAYLNGLDIEQTGA